MWSLPFILGWLQPFLVLTAALPRNNATALTPSRPTTDPTLNTQPTKFPLPHSTDPLPATSSSAIPTIAPKSSISAASSATTNTTEYTLGIPGLNQTDISAEDHMFNFGPEKAVHVRCFLARAMHAIAEPKDCYSAHRRIMHGAKKFTSEKYEGARAWSVKSCAIWFGPENPEEAEEAKFLRWEIYKHADDIIRICVTNKHGFRGGFVAMGYGKKRYRVIVGPRDV